MEWSSLYKSLFAILRIDTTISKNNARVAGTGFVININPIYILTCNHVVSEGTQNNNGNIIYSIAKNSSTIKDFDTRSGQITYLKVKRIYHKPEYDLAIIEVDPLSNKEAAQKLGIPGISSLKIDFQEKRRDIGLSIEWISVGVLGDLSLTPRFFKGNIVTKYIADQGYKFKNTEGKEQNQIMQGIKLLEIDQLFFPGCSGSPVASSKKKKVIGYVHGFKSWPISTNREIKYKAEMSDDSSSRNFDIKSNAILVASLSLAIDARNIKDFLIKNNFIK